MPPLAPLYCSEINNDFTSWDRILSLTLVFLLIPLPFPKSRRVSIGTEM
jgi:hypothetical protein